MANEFFNDDFLAAFRNAKNNNNNNVVVGNLATTTTEPVSVTINDVVNSGVNNSSEETTIKTTSSDNSKDSISLLNFDERLKLMNILKYIANVKSLIKKYIVDNDNRIRNAILVHGPAGNGKTTMITDLMQDLITSGDILESNLVTGHITQIGLTEELMRHNSISKSSKNPLKTIRSVTIFDDTDIFNDKKTFQVLKNAFNTRNRENNNRFVCCKSKNQDVRYNYRGIGIFVCNNSFTETDDFDIQAFISRCEDIEINMTTEELFIYGKYLLENAIKEDISYTNDKADKFVKFFNNTLQKYYDNGVFNKVFFSLRTMLVVKDNFDEYDNSWFDVLNEFIRLNKVNNEIIQAREFMAKQESEKRDKLNDLLNDSNSQLVAFVNANLNNLINKYSFDYVLKAVETLRNAENVYEKYKGRTNYLTIEENREYKRASHDFFVYKKEGFYDASLNKKDN